MTPATYAKVAPPATVLYVAVLFVSVLVLGGAVFLAARSALEQQMAARIGTELEFMRDELRTGRPDHLLAVVRSHGRGAGALDYPVQDRTGAHLAGEMPVTTSLRPGWTTIAVPETTEHGGCQERVPTLITDLRGGLLLAVGDDLGRIIEIEEAVATAFLSRVGLAALPGVRVHGDQELLTQAAANMVENALQHMLAGTRIAIRLSGTRTADVCFCVEDDGPDVAAADLQHLVYRFYRCELSRTVPGNGLSLNLVAAGARLHGATLRLRAAEPGLWAGIIFSVAPA